MIGRVELAVSVVIASERVRTLLPECLSSLERQQAAPAFEVLVVSAEPPESEGIRFPLRWIRDEGRNPSRRRNRAAREARGRCLAFVDDDAAPEPSWVAAGAAALGSAEIVGGPDLGPVDAPYSERVSNLLLATPWIGSGVPAHEWNPRGGPVRSAHDVALCNLFVRRAMDAGLRVVLDPAVRVRHRRRGFPGPYLAQRWRYRVKTGRLLVQRPGLHARGRVAALLAAGFASSAGLALFGPRVLAGTAAVYAALTWALSFPIWRRDPVLFPAVPFAFAAHHATYFAGLLAGIAGGTLAAVAGR